MDTKTSKKQHLFGGFSHGYVSFLVGGFNPFEKYARQIGSSPRGSG